MRTSVSLLVVLALALGGCSSDDKNDGKDGGPDKDSTPAADKAVTPDPDNGTDPDKGTTEDQGEPPAGFELALEVWEMNEADGAKNMFDKNKKDGEDLMGLTFEAVEAGDGGIINDSYDAGWTAFAYRGPFIMYIVAQTGNDKAKLKEDTIAFMKHFASVLPAASEGKKVEVYVPGDNAVAGWVENGDVGAPGVESAYNDTDIEALINGHHLPYAEEGTTGFAKQDYKK